MIVKYPDGVVGTITTAFGAKNYSNHQELMEGSVVVLNEVFATLRSGGDGGVPSSRGEHLVAEEDTVRRLTPVECERLQGFPDDWTAIHTDTHRYKQMGNAVTVNVLRWIGGRV